MLCHAERVEPVGVTMAAKELGTQLIELSSTDKDFIAVSEEVLYIVASCDCHVTCHIDRRSHRCRIRYAITVTTAELGVCSTAMN